uniref:Transducin/WD40 repeat-like superfamily protein n=1 Tax=Zea mays TaxID=4577 RepID=A0A804LJF5_MAIZE
MGLSSKPLHRGVKHDISCLSQDSYGPYIAASCMDNIIYLYSVLHMNKGLIKVYTSIKIRVFFRQGGVKHDISCLSQDSYGPYIAASCMDNIIYLYSVLHMNKGLIKDNSIAAKSQIKFLKVENLGNQLVQQKGKPKIEVYEKDRKKGAGALTTHARVQ